MRTLFRATWMTLALAMFFIMTIQGATDNTRVMGASAPTEVEQLSKVRMVVIAVSILALAGGAHFAGTVLQRRRVPRLGLGRLVWMSSGT